MIAIKDMILILLYKASVIIFGDQAPMQILQVFALSREYLVEKQAVT